jgi:hypothetical protein
VSTPAEKTWLRVLGTMNEYQARLLVAERAVQLGRGGVSRLSRCQRQIEMSGCLPRRNVRFTG